MICNEIAQSKSIARFVFHTLRSDVMHTSPASKECTNLALYNVHFFDAIAAGYRLRNLRVVTHTLVVIITSMLIIILP